MQVYPHEFRHVGTFDGDKRFSPDMSLVCLSFACVYVCVCVFLSLSLRHLLPRITTYLKPSAPAAVEI